MAGRRPTMMKISPLLGRRSLRALPLRTERSCSQGQSFITDHDHAIRLSRRGLTWIKGRHTWVFGGQLIETLRQLRPDKHRQRLLLL